jgi:ribose 5-phosphate isomerase B
VRISLASDHAGFTLKEEIKKFFDENNYQYHDFGAFDQEPVDYPDLAYLAARAVQKGDCERGIIVCGTGIGVCMAANKLKGIRAAHCGESFSARFCRQHNDANILTLGSRVIGVGLALEIAQIFLETPFEGGRHRRRVAKIHRLEGS